MISYETWLRLIRDEKYCRIKKTKLDNGITITTSWLGMPTGYGPTGPKIYATVVRETNKDNSVTEYATEEEALEHHKHLVDTHTDPKEHVSRWVQIIKEL